MIVNKYISEKIITTTTNHTYTFYIGAKATLYSVQIDSIEYFTVAIGPADEVRVQIRS